MLGFILLFGLVFAVLFQAPFVQGQSGTPGQLLSFASSARDLSLGGAMTALPQGANSLYWNPALLSGISQKDVGFMQAALFNKTNMNWIGYAHPLNSRTGSLGLHALQLKSASGIKTDAFNEPQGSFSSSEFAFGIGYGFSPLRNKQHGLGLGFNFLQRSLDTVSNNLYGMDLGAHFSLVKKVKTGLVFQNIVRGKQGDTDDKLPSRIKLGNVYEPVSGLLLMADLELADFTSPSFSAGTEFAWKHLSFRVGRPQQGEFSFGMGFNWKSVRLDVGMASQKDLEWSQLVSLGIGFGKDRAVTRAALTARWLENAQTEYVKGQWIKAKAELEKAAKADPSNFSANFRHDRISALLSTLDLDSKEQDKQYRFIGSGESGRLIRKGVTAFIEGNNSDAGLLLNHALAYRPDDEKLMRLLSLVESAANVQTEKFPGLGPDEIIKMQLGKVQDYFRMEKYEEALKVCLDTVKLAPEMPAVRVKLGSVYYALRDIPKARKEYQKALELNPNDTVLKNFMRLQGWLID